MGLVGTLAELILAEHTEDAWQLVPLFLLGGGVVVLGAVAVWRKRGPLLVFRMLMAAFLASGVVGTWLHYSAKTEFALERYPSITGLELVREAIKGSSPPLLAPGAMIALGLIGLAWAWRQPDTTGESNDQHA